jgi:hypothetical protein
VTSYTLTAALLLFEVFIWKRIICQDRLGTDIRKSHSKTQNGCSLIAHEQSQLMEIPPRGPLDVAATFDLQLLAILPHMPTALPPYGVGFMRASRLHRTRSFEGEERRGVTIEEHISSFPLLYTLESLSATVSSSKSQLFCWTARASSR